MGGGGRVESALITFLVTASNVTLLGLGAAFWGLVFGILANVVLNSQFGSRLLDNLRAGAAKGRT